MASRLLLATVFTAITAFAQTPSQSGVDLGAMDTSVSPCTNFYQYACGSWRAQHPIPSDQARWGRFNELNDRNQKIARDILEKAAAQGAHRSEIDTKIGDYYAACMDEAAIERKGIQPIQAQLDSVTALKTKEQLAGEMSRLQNDGVSGFVRFSAEPDPKHASIEIAGFRQSGLGLPDRDYYLKSDRSFGEDSGTISTAHREHVRPTCESHEHHVGFPGQSRYGH